MIAVINWLNSGRPYDKGLELFLSLKADRNVYDRLKIGDSEENRKILFHALKSVLNTQQVAIPKPEITTKPEIKEENEASLAARRDADKAFKTLQNTRALMLAICDAVETPQDKNIEFKKQRGIYARAIMKQQAIVDEAYDDYHYAQKHGERRTPPVEESEYVAPERLHQTISNLRKYISKLKHGPQKFDTESRILAKTALLEKYLKEYNAGKP